METKTIEVSTELADQIERFKDKSFLDSEKDYILEAFDKLDYIYKGGCVKDPGVLGYIVSNYYNILKAARQ